MRFAQFRHRNTAQASLGKFDRLPRTPAGSTVLAFDGCGLRDQSPARPARNASYPVSVRQVAVLLHASFRHRLAVMPLRFAKPSPPSGWPGDFHPQAIEHARHATKPLRGSGAHSATRPHDRKRGTSDEPTPAVAELDRTSVASYNVTGLTRGCYYPDEPQGRFQTLANRPTQPQVAADLQRCLQLVEIPPVFKRSIPNTQNPCHARAGCVCQASSRTGQRRSRHRCGHTWRWPRLSCGRLSPTAF